jgi:hypothetical protein
LIHFRLARREVVFWQCKSAEARGGEMRLVMRWVLAAVVFAAVSTLSVVSLNAEQHTSEQNLLAEEPKLGGGGG